MAKKSLKSKGGKIPKQDIKLIAFLSVLGYMAVLGVCLLYRNFH